jgi:signal peptidase I
MLMLAAAALAALIATRAIVGRRWIVVVVTGTSMAPTFQDGERVLVRRRHRAPRLGDAVVFAAPETRRGELALRVKRVAAIAGDRVPEWAHAALGAGDVPIDHVVVAGDNPHSQDSRQLGFIPTSAVIAIVDREPALHVTG